jgi:hypothetical protein
MEVARSLGPSAMCGSAHQGVQRHWAWGRHSGDGGDEIWGQKEEEEANIVGRRDKVKRE